MSDKPIDSNNLTAMIKSAKRYLPTIPQPIIESAEAATLATVIATPLDRYTACRQVRKTEHDKTLKSHLSHHLKESGKIKATTIKRLYPGLAATQGKHFINYYLWYNLAPTIKQALQQQNISGTSAHIIASLITGIAQAYATAPLTVITTNFYTGDLKNYREVPINIPANQFFSGANKAILRNMMFLGLYPIIKDSLGTFNTNNCLPQELIRASAGALATLISYPIDTLRRRECFGIQISIIQTLKEIASELQKQRHSTTLTKLCRGMTAGTFRMAAVALAASALDKKPTPEKAAELK